MPAAANSATKKNIAKGFVLVSNKTEITGYSSGYFFKFLTLWYDLSLINYSNFFRVLYTPPFLFQQIKLFHSDIFITEKNPAESGVLLTRKNNK